MITAGIMLPMLVAGVGAAVSYSSGSATRAGIQNALDAAVLAGASASDLSDPAAAIAIASKTFDSNVGGFARSAAKDIVAKFKVEGLVLSGEAAGTLANPFGGVVGSRTMQIGVRSAATKQAIPICVLGLNGFDNGAFDINGGPIFNADCAVQANSNGSSAMSQEGKAAVVKAKKFGVSGGHKTETYEPPPADGSKKIPDPYASIPFPAHTPCDKGSKLLQIKDDTVLSPGTYCGGVHINGDSPKVTLQPGVYVMVDGPFWINGGGIVSGDKVMIAFTGKGSTLQVWGDAAVKLTSPMSGPYANMQFMQDRDSDDTHGLWVSIGGNSGGKTSNAKLDYDGVAYFPNQNFWTFGNAVLNANSPGVAIVAAKIWTQGNATVNVTSNNKRNLGVTAPTTTYSARLIK